MGRCFSFLIGILWLFSSAALCTAAGSTSAQFLTIPVGGRPAALGAAYSPLATDVFALAYNPGGLGFLPSTEISAQHLSYLSQTKNDYVGFAMRLGKKSSLGVSFQNMDSGLIQRADELGKDLGNYSVSGSNLCFGYAYQITDRASVGMAAKNVAQDIDGYRARAQLFDVGILYQRTPRLSFSAVVDNWGQSFQFNEEQEPLPRSLKLGIAVHSTERILFSIEAIKPYREKPNLRAGLEWHVIDVIFLRCGYRPVNQEKLSGLAGFSAGMGFLIWGQHLDFAWIPYGELGDTQYLSMTIKWPQKQNLHESNPNTRVIFDDKE